MKLRTFTAPNMPAAMKMVREEMGDEAIIVASEHHSGRRAINVTAVIDRDDDELLTKTDEPAPQNDNSALDELRFEVQNILRFHNLPELFTAKMLQKATDRDMSAAIALHRVGGHRDIRHLYRLAIEKIAEGYFQFDPLPLEEPGARIMLIGAPGIGKTLTAAKVAARLTLDQQPLTVFTTDNKRAGGIEQLQAFTDILNLELKVTPTPSELGKELRKLPRDARAIIDTAGCNPYDHAELKELKIFTQLDGIEPVLVMQAGSDSLEAIDTVETFATMPIKRLLVTRADTARRFGGVLAAAAAHKLAFCNVSASSSIIDTLQPAEPALLAQMLLRYQLQS